MPPLWFTLLRGAKGAAGTPPPPMTTFHGAVVFRTTDQVITPGDAVSFDTAEFDTDSFFDVGTHPTRLTIPTTGKYAFGFNVSLDPINLPGGDIFVQLNGATGLASVGSDAVVTFESFSASGLWDFTAGDFIELIIEYDATLLGTVGQSEFYLFNYT